MKPPRGLTAQEQAAWEQLAASVTPLDGRKRDMGHARPLKSGGPTAERTAGAPPRNAGSALYAKPSAPRAVTPRTPVTPPEPRDLDSHWERRFKGGRVEPDLTLDLHGHTLDEAYARITTGLDQARAMGARVVLVIAGRAREAAPADRGHRRGAIRAKLLDWIAASHHASAIAAVRRAHIRHGGEGALYLVLKRRR